MGLRLDFGGAAGRRRTRWHGRHLFDIGSGRVVDLWSNGVFGSGAPADYGIAVATHDLALDYVEGGVSTAVAAVPEPSTYAFMLGGLGVVGGIARRRKARALRISTASDASPGRSGR